MALRDLKTQSREPQIARLHDYTLDEGAYEEKPHSSLVLCSGVGKADGKRCWKLTDIYGFGTA